MLIIVARDHAGLYEGLKPRQEANGQDRVLLERRVGDRRRTPAGNRTSERRERERRAPISDAERALLRVLGFMVLHPAQEHGQAPVAPPQPPSPAARAA